MAKHLLALLFLIACSAAVYAQSETAATRHDFTFDRVGQGSFLNERSFEPKLKNLEMPKPNSGTTRAHLQEIKKEVRKQFPLGGSSDKNAQLPHSIAAFGGADSLIQARNFEGNQAGNSVPNDNTLAISNDGQLISCINSTISAYDIPGDSLLFTQTLASFSLDLWIVGSKFDPKVQYDPINDRFILVFLNGNNPLTSQIIVAFSSTNQLQDPWYLFSLPGDPVQDSTWSDYPALTLTENELFITVNQIIPGEPWQTGFAQSIIWQIDKQAAFAGDTTLHATLWTDIKLDGRPIRNLNPVKGGTQPYGPNAYFLSNRNFDLQNDTVFMVEVTNVATAQDATVNVTYGLTDTPYGVPPEARQQGNHRFDTNDGRWLGAFLENDRIQFVGNTVNPATGLAAVYHGFIDSLEADHPPVTGYILGDASTDSLDFGYPNMVYVGEHGCDDEAVIIFEHSSPTVFAGYSAVYYDNFGNYSPRKVVKEGDNYVDVLTGGYERWGDYTGIQRKYNEPGRVWAAANFGKLNRRNGTWITELIVGDSVPSIATTTEATPTSLYNETDGSVTVTVEGGYEPLSYEWNDPQGQTTASVSGLSAGDYVLTITDASNCKVAVPVTVEQPAPQSAIFPNPVADQLFINFNLGSPQLIDCAIYDARGGLVKYIYQGQAQEGDNVFTFNTAPLAKGVYIFKITTADGELVSQKLVKE